MPATQVGFTIVVWVCSFVFLVGMSGPALAVLKQGLRPASSVVSAKPSRAIAARDSKAKITRPKQKGPIIPGSLSDSGEEWPIRVRESRSSTRKHHRKARASKKKAPKAIIRPRTDLTPHGIIEGPQRYDPRPNYRTAGVRDPGTRDLIYDHFQELDRNQDGAIDPVERAFGRLDIDRDLHRRALQ